MAPPPPLSPPPQPPPPLPLPPSQSHRPLPNSFARSRNRYPPTAAGPSNESNERSPSTSFAWPSNALRSSASRHPLGPRNARTPPRCRAISCRICRSRPAEHENAVRSGSARSKCKLRILSFIRIWLMRSHYAGVHLSILIWTSDKRNVSHDEHENQRYVYQPAPQAGINQPTQRPPTNPPILSATHQPTHPPTHRSSSTSPTHPPLIQHKLRLRLRPERRCRAFFISWTKYVRKKHRSVYGTVIWYALKFENAVVYCPHNHPPAPPIHPTPAHLK